MSVSDPPFFITAILWKKLNKSLLILNLVCVTAKNTVEYNELLKFIEIFSEVFEIFFEVSFEVSASCAHCFLKEQKKHKQKQKQNFLQFFITTIIT